MEGLVLEPPPCLGNKRRKLQKQADGGVKRDRSQKLIVLSQSFLVFSQDDESRIHKVQKSLHAVMRLTTCREVTKAEIGTDHVTQHMVSTWQDRNKYTKLDKGFVRFEVEWVDMSVARYPFSREASWQKLQKYNKNVHFRIQAV